MKKKPRKPTEYNIDGVTMMMNTQYLPDLYPIGVVVEGHSEEVSVSGAKEMIEWLNKAIAWAESNSK